MLLMVTTTANAYRVAEVVDMDIVVNGVQSDALRSQMPLFGVTWISPVRFEMDELLPRDARTFSLKFEDGLWTLPATPLTKGGDHLEMLTVQFIYSKSGAGAIHSVSSKDAIYSAERQPYFTVKYHWIEEEAVYLSAGHAVMFLAVFVSSVIFLLISCRFIDEDGVGTSAASGSTLGHSVAVPKWD